MPANGFVGKIAGALHVDGMAVFVAGAVAAVLQTLVIRELFAVVSGNELSVGITLALWLAATAAGSALGGRYAFLSTNALLVAQVLLFCGGLTLLRAVRLTLLPGAAVSPLLMLPLLAAVAGPGACCCGILFGKASKNRDGNDIYRWEQAGTLAGLAVVSALIWFREANYLIAAAIFLLPLPVLRGTAGRVVLAAAIVAFFASDRTSSAWKYPLPVEKIVYAHEGEVATAAVDGQKVSYVNGSVYAVSYTTPAVEQAVHAPLSMHPLPKSVLIINSSGHYAEAGKYRDADVRCVRFDHFLEDSCCPYGTLARMERWQPYDAVILGCTMPDNLAASRFFTRSFFGEIRKLTGDSGIFSFTLPFQGEYTDEREEKIRSILLNTLRSQFLSVKILPGDGYTFIASGADYPFPDTCRVQNDYFQPVILAQLTPQRLEEANRPAGAFGMHTAAHPRLLLPVLDRYLSRFNLVRWMVVAVPVLLVLLLFPVIKRSADMLSVGTSGACTGIFSVAVLLLYQSLYGTVYARLSLLLLALAAGFAAGCFVKKLPCSDFAVGTVLAGTLAGLSLFQQPPAVLFLGGNAAAGFITSAQFVTRPTRQTGVLYAADCAGGVLGMALASTVLIPQFGAAAVAAGIMAVKLAAGMAARWR